MKVTISIVVCVGLLAYPIYAENSFLNDVASFNQTRDLQDTKYDCVCTYELRPVCGCDNKVYPNACAARNCGKGECCCEFPNGNAGDRCTCSNDSEPCPGAV